VTYDGDRDGGTVHRERLDDRPQAAARESIQESAQLPKPVRGEVPAIAADAAPDGQRVAARRPVRVPEKRETFPRPRGPIG